MRCGNRLVGVREFRSVFERHGVFRVHEQAARAADHDKTHVGAGEHVGQMLGSVRDCRQSLFGPSADRVHDHIESGEVCGNQVECILDHNVRCDALVFTAHDGGYVMTAFHGFLDDELSFASVRCHNCDLHNVPFVWVCPIGV